MAHHGMTLQQAIDASALHTTHVPSSFAPRGRAPGGLVVEDRLGGGVVVAEADGDAYEPRHPVAEPLGHHTGMGTGELRPMRVGRRQVSDTDDGKVLDDGSRA
jgi:hypothetical protein